MTSFDGVPDAATAQKVFDNLDFQRAVQAYLNSMREGILKYGPANTTALLFEELMDSKTLWLTPNTVSIYMALWLDLTDGPVVMETPPNVIGIVDDAWFHYVADFGQVGPDKNKGGKYLFLPPGYKGDIPGTIAVAYMDSKGNPLDGSKTYRVPVPPNVPMKAFWSFTLYDNQTRFELQTDQQLLSMNALREGQASAGCAKLNQTCIFDQLMDSKSLFLNGNTSTMYAIGFLDLSTRRFRPLPPIFATSSRSTPLPPRTTRQRRSSSMCRARR